MSLIPVFGPDDVFAVLVFDEIFGENVPKERQPVPRQRTKYFDAPPNPNGIGPTVE
jgi:hypothetical protein